MTITVLLAPDGTRVWAAFGKHSLWSAADLMEAVSRGETLPAQAAYIANHGVTFDAFVWDNEIRELAPGYRLEHHNLAELLARPTAAEADTAVEQVKANGLAALDAERARCLDAIQATAKLAEDRAATETAALRRERDALAERLTESGLATDRLEGVSPCETCGERPGVFVGNSGMFDCEHCLRARGDWGPE